MAKDLLSVSDLRANELESILNETKKIKASPKKYYKKLQNKTLAMIFEKPSTRTRVSFQVAMYELGGFSIVLNPEDMQLGRGETIADSARVLSRYVEGIMARVYSHNTLVELAENSTIPIINGLSDIEHPCQIISDLFTIKEKAGKLKRVNLAYIGDGNNVCNSLILGCAMTGVNLKVASPDGFKPNAEFIKKTEKLKRSKIDVLVDPKIAVKDADFIYTDVWVSMGDEKETKERIKAFQEYQINSELLKVAKKNPKIMHCLPAHRGQEITDDVIDSKNSIVWDQAENRLHAQKAILLHLMKK